jgi:hypothetical protein
MLAAETGTYFVGRAVASQAVASRLLTESAAVPDSFSLKRKVLGLAAEVYELAASREAVAPVPPRVWDKEHVDQWVTAQSAWVKESQSQYSTHFLDRVLAIGAAINSRHIVINATEQRTLSGNAIITAKFPTSPSEDAMREVNAFKIGTLMEHVGSTLESLSQSIKS